MFERLTFTGAIITLAICVGGSVARCAENERGPVGQPAVIPGASLKKDSAPVDETALRYYASLKQTSRVEAETRRLQRLNPNWSPPVDLWTSRPGNADEGPLWELFAADKLVELRKAIEMRRSIDPNWAPSTDLAQKLLHKEMRARILAGKNSGRWADAADAADQGRFEGEAVDVELLWDISDAYARTRRLADALRILTLILNTRSDPKERIATIHRAIACLPMADVERLVVLAKINGSESQEFAALGVDITRARISAFLHDEAANGLTDAEFDRFKDYARAAMDPSQPGLVAWYALKHNELREALEWFKSAIARGGDATIAHGLAHTLKRLGQLREAEEIAYAWREPSPANAILFIDILADQMTQAIPVQLDAKRISRYAEVTLQTSSGEGAQALAWFAYNSCQFDVALDWFRRSVAWFPKEASVFGYALTLRRLKRQHDFVEIVNRYDGLFPKVLELLFPEGKSPISPCDTLASAKLVRVSEKPSEFLDLRVVGSTRDTRAFAMPDALSKVTRATVPKPFDVATEAREDIPLVRRAEFPVAVSPENPLRFAAAAREQPRANAPEKWRDPDGFFRTTAARRVPGVGAMPYERFGLMVLRGWNGSDQPSFAPGMQVQSPLGTLWRTEQTTLSLGAAASEMTVIGKSSPTMSDAAGDVNPDFAPRFHPDAGNDDVPRCLYYRLCRWIVRLLGFSSERRREDIT